MKIKVHMLAFEEKEVIRMVTLPPDTPSDNDDDLLGLAFHYGQNDFAIGREKNKSCSVSVSDVVELPDGKLFIVMPTGFKQINLSQLDYIRQLPMRERHDCNLLGQ
jgi:hypothetical protein